MNHDPVQELIRLLGSPFVFISWPRGVKAADRRWKHLTGADMTPEYLTNLINGNIGVALGEVSGGLCAIDCDTEEFAERFLSENPHLKDTLQTHGARGRVFWVRFTGSYLKRTIKLKSRSGADVGEFRSNGSQSIVWGTHPDTKQPYKFIVKRPAMVVEFSSIVWPAEIKNPPKLPCIEVDRGTEGHSVSSVPSVFSDASSTSVSSIHCAGPLQILSLEDVLRRCVPDGVHQNNPLLFNLARGIKTLEQLKGGTFSTEQLGAAFEQWHARSVKFLRQELTKEDYWIEFLNAYASAKYPLGGDTIPTAWKLAHENPLPTEAGQFKNPQLRLLVAFCRELQILNGEKPFYLSSYLCQRLFGHANHTTAATWLRVLCVLKLIQVVEKGNTKRATRYKFLGSIM